MNKIVAISVIILASVGLTGIGSAAGKPPPDPASITLDQDATTLTLGSTVTFTTEIPKLRGNQWPMVGIRCTRGTTALYGQLAEPDTVFVLGGGSSPWWDDPGPAECEATLYAYSLRTGPDDLATVTWEVAA